MYFYSAFDISLRARLRPVPLTYTLHTLPNPPRPTTSFFSTCAITLGLMVSRGEGSRVGCEDLREEVGCARLSEQDSASGVGRREAERVGWWK